MWFNNLPERWTGEQQELEAAGIQYEVDIDLKAQGFLRLSLVITAMDGIPADFLPLQLQVDYPETYPYFRPSVNAPGITLPRHQNLIDKNLCLLPRETDNWRPETTLAALLLEQLPKIFREGFVTDPDILKENEDEQAEPVSEYYGGIPNASVIMDTLSFDLIPTTEGPAQFLGTIDLRFASHFVVPTRIFGFECFDQHRNSIAKLPDLIAEQYPLRGTAGVYRTQIPPPTADPNEGIAWITALIRESRLKPLKFNQSVFLKDRDTVNNVIAITFPEEHRLGERSWGWLFIVSGTVSKRRDAPAGHYQYFARVNRYNMGELAIRIPKLRPLATKTVTVLGLGAIGGPSAIELAKNGVKELRLVDFDFVNAGTTVRWPLGLSSAGMFKTEALTKFINENYPEVLVKTYHYRIGAVRINQDGKILPAPSLPDILDGSSLVYDATVEVGVSHMIAVESQNRRIPFIIVYGTMGVWGGVVMRQLPSPEKGCWMCFQHSIDDGQIALPPADMSGKIQASGCGDLSFTGTSFELGNIVNAGVRMAVATMCRGTDGYEDFNSDVGVLSLVNEEQKPIFPTWKDYVLAKHPSCPYCNPGV